MNLSIKDRKQLWSASGGMCSYHFNGEDCERKLFTTNGEIDTNLGEECHIIGKEPGSARYQEEFSDKETYSNAILLCNTHHKIIDDNPNVYPVDVLKKMKTTHEQLISAKITKKEISSFVLKDCQFIVDGVKAEETVIGFDAPQSPMMLSNVNVTVRDSQAKNVYGARFSAGLTAMITSCPKCKRPFGVSFSGQGDFLKECPYCQHQFK